MVFKRYMVMAAGLAIAGAPSQLTAPAFAQAAISAEALSAIQGRWISRFENNDTEIEIVGQEIRYIRAKPLEYNASVRPEMRYNPPPGTLAVIITQAKVDKPLESLIDKRPRPQFQFRGRCVSNHGSSWRMTDNDPCSGGLNAHTTFKDVGIVSRPDYEYVTLSFSGLMHGGGSFWRPEAKRRIFGPASAGPPPRPSPPRPPVKKPDPAPVIKPRPPAPATPVKGTAGQIPSGKVLQEAPAVPADAARQQANREQAAAAKRQLEENAANQRAYDRAVREREAAIARQKAEYQAALARTEAERLRREQDHAAALARWQADVEACKKGDKSRCAK
jgi:hypothetical protein